MKVIKQYAWEPSFEDRVLEIRQGELKRLKKISYMQSLNLTLIRLNPVILAGECRSVLRLYLPFDLAV